MTRWWQSDDPCFLSPSVLGDLQARREELNSQIRREEEEKDQMQQDLQFLSDQLRRVEDNLIQIVAARAAVENTITETEAEYTKVTDIYSYIQQSSFSIKNMILLCANLARDQFKVIKL